MHRRLLLVLPLLLVPAVASADPFGCHNTEARHLSAAVSGATRIVIVGAAGSLKVTGQPGAANVEANGTACASDKDYLKEITLAAHRDGAELRIEAVLPGQTFSTGWMEARLDFEVTVPDNVAIVVRDGSGDTSIASTGPLEVVDGSGSLDIRNVKGGLKVEDGSGDLTIAGVTGDVKIDDGSGSMDVERIGGNVVITDGSGSIDVRNVQKSVTIADDGSGGVDVRDVGGNFVVEDKGSGAVSYERVAGRVSVPHRR